VKLNGTHQLVVNAEDVTLLGKNINTTTEKNTEIKLHSSEGVGLEVKAEKISIWRTNSSNKCN
jgi:hypothetical protein